MLIKIITSIFGDPHAWFAGVGLTVAWLPAPQDLELWGKAACSAGGFVIVLMTGYHKYLQIKKEKKNEKHFRE